MQENTNNNSLFQWKPFTGVGALSFTASEEELLEVLGEAEDRDEEEYPGLKSKTYWYYSLGLSISIGYYDGEMGPTIEIGLPKLYLGDIALHEKSFEELYQILYSFCLIRMAKKLPLTEELLSTTRDMAKYEKEVSELEDGGEEVYYHFPHLGLSFWYATGRVNDIAVSEAEQLVLLPSGSPIFS